MTYYSKVIAAIVGLLILLASRYGIDLESQEQLIVDAVVAVVTAVSVYFVKNKPATTDQLREVKQELPTAKEIRDADDAS